MKEELNVTLQLGKELFTFQLSNRNEIPEIAKIFCAKHQLNEECIDFIIQSFNE